MGISRQKPLKDRMKTALLPLELSVQYADASAQVLAARSTLRRWVRMGLEAPARITLRFVSAQEGRALNQAYRGKDYATNVLTFHYDAPAGIHYAADIVICTSVVRKEAKAQGKPVRHHLAHLVIHGVLHAQGHDHEQPKQAQRMEAREIALLAALRIANPYE